MSCKKQQENYASLNGCYILGPTGPTGPAGTPGGATGPTGPQGLVGATGPAPQLTIGTVETGLPGSQASVNITPMN